MTAKSSEAQEKTAAGLPAAASKDDAVAKPVAKSAEPAKDPDSAKAKSLPNPRLAKPRNRLHIESGDETGCR